MNYAVDLSEDKKYAVIVTEDGGACTITNEGDSCIIRMFQHKIETEYTDDIFELLSNGRVYLKKMAGTEVNDSMINYCIDWLIPMDDFTEVDFDSLIFNLNKFNNMNDI